MNHNAIIKELIGDTSAETLSKSEIIQNIKNNLTGIDTAYKGANSAVQKNQKAYAKSLATDYLKVSATTNWLKNTQKKIRNAEEDISNKVKNLTEEKQREEAIQYIIDSILSGNTKVVFNRAEKMGYQYLLQDSTIKPSMDLLLKTMAEVKNGENTNNLFNKPVKNYNGVIIKNIKKGYDLLNKTRSLASGIELRYAVGEGIGAGSRYVFLTEKEFMKVLKWDGELNKKLSSKFEVDIDLNYPILSLEKGSFSLDGIKATVNIENALKKRKTKQQYTMDSSDFNDELKGWESFERMFGFEDMGNGTFEKERYSSLNQSKFYSLHGRASDFSWNPFWHGGDTVIKQGDNYIFVQSKYGKSAGVSLRSVYSAMKYVSTHLISKLNDTNKLKKELESLFFTHWTEESSEFIQDTLYYQATQAGIEHLNSLFAK